MCIKHGCSLCVNTACVRRGCSLCVNTQCVLSVAVHCVLTQRVSGVAVHCVLTQRVSGVCPGIDDVFNNVVVSSGDMFISWRTSYNKLGTY